MPKKEPSSFEIVGSRAKQKFGSRARKSLISKFCYLKMGDFRHLRAVRIKQRHLEEQTPENCTTQKKIGEFLNITPD